MKPKITVIVPTLNEESCIVETLKSISNQDIKPNYDIIVCDGGSTDNTVKLAQKYAKVLRSPIRGKVDQLNFATKHAKGDILLFLDADTMLPHNYFQRIFELFENESNLWACGAKFKYWPEGNWKQRASIKLANFILLRYFDVNILFRSTKLPGCNICIRHEIFNKVGGFKDLPNEDSALCTALKQLYKNNGPGKVRYLRRPVVSCSPRRIIELGFFKVIQFYRKKEKRRFKEQKV